MKLNSNYRNEALQNESKLNSVYTFSYYFPNIQCNIFLPSTPTSFKWSLPFSISHRTQGYYLPQNISSSLTWWS